MQEGGRAPSAPPPQKKTAAPKLELQGIFIIIYPLRKSQMLKLSDFKKLKDRSLDKQDVAERRKEEVSNEHKKNGLQISSKF